MSAGQTMAQILRRAARVEERYQGAINRQRRSIDGLLKDREKLIAVIESHIAVCSRSGEGARLRKVLDEVAGN